MQVEWATKSKVELMMSLTEHTGLSIRSIHGALSQALILIAEDEVEIAEIVAAYLQRSGLRTVHAIDGHDALAKYQSLST